MNYWWPVEVEREYPGRQVKATVLSPVEAEERPSEVVVQAFGLFLLTKWYPTKADADRVKRYWDRKAMTSQKQGEQKHEFDKI